MHFNSNFVFYFQVNVPAREEHYTPPSSPNINHASISAKQVIKSFASSTKLLQFFRKQIYDNNFFFELNFNTINIFFINFYMIRFG